MNAENFWMRVRIDSPTNCWEWIGSKYKRGYGHFTVKTNGKTHNFYAHRLAVELFPGREGTTVGKVVMHKCDNPSCCNPFHLSVGTQKENMEDMISKGRSSRGKKREQGNFAKGETVASSKLTEETVKQIRSEYLHGIAGHKSNTSLTGLATKYGIAFQTVSKIVNRQSWRHI